MAYREDPRNSLLAGQLSNRPYFGDRHRDRAARSYTPALRFEMYTPATPWTWAFMVATVVQAMVVLGLESYVLITGVWLTQY